jgi:hypothetical protein
MSIKAMSINENEKREKSYPYVGVSRGPNGYVCVLFVCSNTGCVVLTNFFDEDIKSAAKYVGDFGTDWVESEFTPIEANIEFGI